MAEELTKAISIPTCVLYGHQWRREYPRLSSDPTKADTLICVGCGTRKPAPPRPAPRPVHPAAWWRTEAGKRAGG